MSHDILNIEKEYFQFAKVHAMTRMRRGLMILVTVLSIILAVSGVVIAQEDGGGGDEEGGLHCILGAIAMVLVLGVLTSGVLTSGRFGRIKGLKPYPVHMIGPIIMSAYMTGVYIYGTVIAEEFSFPGNFHGLLGLLTVILSWGTVGSSPCAMKKMAKREVLSKVHRVMAIVLVAAIAAQILYAYLFMGD
jgi:hypothetical protein